MWNGLIFDDWMLTSNFDSGSRRRLGRVEVRVLPASRRQARDTRQRTHVERNSSTVACYFRCCSVSHMSVVVVQNFDRVMLCIDNLMILRCSRHADILNKH